MSDSPTETPEAAPAGPHADIDPRLMEILVCPVSRGPLVYDRARQELVSAAARLAFPIRDGIPILLADEARELGANESR